MRYIGSVQYDPLDVVGRSHDLALWGRIAGYRPEDLEAALYRRRTVFETGGNVQIVSIEELPALRLAMGRKVREERWRRFRQAKGSVISRVRRALEARGPLGPRDFGGGAERPIRNFRARTEAGLALYYLWLSGDAMIAFRRRGEKVFDLASHLLRRPVPDLSVEEVEERLILGTLGRLGIATGSEWLARAHTQIGRSTLRYEWGARLARWRASGAIQAVEVTGWRGPHWILADASPDLDTVASSDVPARWRPRSGSTTEEAVFLAPLEVTTAHGRAKALFDFEYLWEVYKPASKRRWGYYTLPILLAEGLPARIELRHDRGDGRLRVLGFWPERPALIKDRSFGQALGRGLARLATFRSSVAVDLTGLQSPVLKREVKHGMALVSPH